MAKGYIKLSRTLFDNKLWKDARTFSEFEAWIDLIQSARFDATPATERIGTHDVTCCMGEYAASNRFLAKKWGRSEQWVKSFLGRLKREGMITTDCTQGVNVITLTNYIKYNCNVTESDDNPPSNPPNSPPYALHHSELQTRVTQSATQRVTQCEKEQPTSNPKNKKEKEREYKSIELLQKTRETLVEAQRQSFTTEELSRFNTFSQVVNEMRRSQIWLSQLCCKYGIGAEEMAKLIDTFSEDCVCNDALHNDVSDAKRHFNQWLGRKTNQRHEKHNETVRPVGGRGRFAGKKPQQPGCGLVLPEGDN